MTMIRKDMKILELSIDMVYNKMKWKKRIHIATSIPWEKVDD